MRLKHSSVHSIFSISAKLGNIKIAITTIVTYLKNPNSLSLSLSFPKTNAIFQPVVAMANQMMMTIAVITAMLLISSSVAMAGSPFIVAHKKITLTRLNSDSERVSVSIDIYNRGSVTAYDVSLTDNSWAPDVFDFVSGNISKSWERLDAGSLVSHSFELESKVKGIFYGAPAVITFRVPTKTVLQEAFSTPSLPLDILADRPLENKFAWAKSLLVKFGPQFSVISLVAAFAYLIANPSKSSAAKGSKKRR